MKQSNLNNSIKQIFTILVSLLVITQLVAASKIKTKAHSPRLVCTSSWNVAESDPPAKLDVWINPECDVIVVGMQEAVLIQGLTGLKNIALSDSSIEKQRKKWKEAILTHLGNNFKYVQYAKKEFVVGILMLLFVKNSYYSEFSKDNVLKKNLDHFKVKTGTHGLTGNKGAISVRMQINGKMFSITNCHLEAHDENHAKRMEQLNKFLNTSYKYDSKKMLAKDHDYCIIMGDLNSRTQYQTANKEQENIAVRAQITSILSSTKDFTPIFEHDQLATAIREGKELKNIGETAPKFAPTFKYDRNTDNFDSSKKQRIPSWCDRVIWVKSAPMLACQKSFSSVPSFKMSDHKPVIATFHIPA